MELVLYGREECHLCEVARDLLVHCGLAEQFVEADIEEDVNLLRVYCLRIPVLKDARSGSELDWPFDESQLIAFIHAAN